MKHIADIDCSAFDMPQDRPALSSLLANYPDAPVSPRELTQPQPSPIELTLSFRLISPKLSALDRNRYQLPAPTSENPTEDEWKAASVNARVQVEHLGVRSVQSTASTHTV